MKKKTKKYAGGGLAGIADTANSLMSDVNSMADTINYGDSQTVGQAQPVGFNAITGMKKGGSVKSSKANRGDGIAQRGKTKGRMV